MSLTTPDSLRFQLQVPSAVPAGEPVQIRFTVQNVSQRPVEIYLRGRTIAFDILVARAHGGIVWRRLEDEIIPAIIQLKVLGPGEMLEFQETWNQRTNQGGWVGPGLYTAQALLLTDAPVSLNTESVPLRIGAERRP